MAETVERPTDTTDEQGTNDNGTSTQPSDRPKQAAQTLLHALSDKTVGPAVDQVEGLAGRLTDVAESGGAGLSSALGGATSMLQGGSPVTGALKAGASSIKDKVTGALGVGGGGDGGGRGRGTFKFMNIFEAQDVGVPRRVAYDQWTQFADFPSFTKKVETVNQESDEKSTWTVQVFWSHRSWDTTIREQIPDSHVIWVSSGAKGHADGIVTFSELAPNLTRIVLVLEYHPQGFLEKTGNLWRAVGRRTRLEFKHFCRHVMMDTLINRDELEGWRGEIRDNEVVKTHEEAMDEEQAAAEDSDEDLGGEVELDSEDEASDGDLEESDDEAEDVDVQEGTEDVDEAQDVDEARDLDAGDDVEGTETPEDHQVDDREDEEREPEARRPRRGQRTPA